MKYKNGKVVASSLGRTSSRYVIGKSRIIEFLIPIFQGSAKDSINLSLICFYDGISHTNNGFGVNANISIYREYVIANNKITIKNPNYEEEIYTFNNSNNRYENLQTGSYITLNSDNTINLYYSNGVSFHYGTSSNKYPISIKENGIERYTITINEYGVIQTIMNKYGHGVVFNGTGIISSINIVYKEDEIETVAFGYASSYINQVTFMNNDDVILNNVEFTIGTTITCYEQMTKKKVEYIRSSSTSTYVSKIDEKIQNNLVNSIVLVSNTIKSTLDPKMYYLIRDGKVVLEYDDLGNVVTYEYDDYNRIKFVSDNYNIKGNNLGDRGNLIENGFLDGGDDSYWSASSATYSIDTIDDIGDIDVQMNPLYCIDYILVARANEDEEVATIKYSQSLATKQGKFYSFMSWLAYCDEVPGSITMKVKLYNDASDYQEVEKVLNVSEYDDYNLATIEVLANKDYSYVDITYELYGLVNVTYYITGLQVYERPLGTHLIYNPVGKMIGYTNGDSKQITSGDEAYPYNTNGTYSTVGYGVSSTGYTQSNVVFAKCLMNGITRNWLYESIEEDSAVILPDETLVAEIKEGELAYLRKDYDYSEDHLSIKQIVDVNNTVTKYEYEENRYKNLLKQVLQEDLGIQFNYTYNMHDYLKTVSNTVNNTTSMVLTYVYGTESSENPNNFNLISEIILKNGRKYYFIYDLVGRLVSIKNGTSFTSSITLATYEYSNVVDNLNRTIHTSKILKHYPNNSGQYYQYIYDSYNYLTSIKYYDGTTLTTIKTFTYDRYKTLSAVEDNNGNVLTYQYDEYGVLKDVIHSNSDISMSYSTQYTYDDYTGNMVSEYHTDSKGKSLRMLDYQTTSSRISPELAMATIRNNDSNIYACFFNEWKEECLNPSLYAIENGIVKRKELIVDPMQLGFAHVDGLRTLAYGAGATYHLGYNFFTNVNKNTFSAGCWFKVDELNSSQYIIHLLSGLSSKVILELTGQGKIKVLINDQVKLTSTSTMDADSYNFVGITINNTELKLYYNNEVLTTTITAMSFNGCRLVYGGYDVSDSISGFVGNIACLVASEEIINIAGYYYITKHFIINKQLDEYPTSSESEYLTDIAQYLDVGNAQFYPLNYTLNSYKGVKPLHVETYNKDLDFVYDNDIRRPAYSIYNKNKLIYSCSPTSGTITFRVKFDKATANQTIMKLTTTQGQIVKLTRNASTKKVTLTVVGAVFTPDTIIEDDTWYTLGLSWMFGTTAAVQASEGDVQPYATYWNYTAQLIIDDNQALTTTKSTIRKAYTNSKLEISMESSDELTGARIESLFVTPNYYETTDLQNVIKSISGCGYTSKNYYNDLGILVHKEYYNKSSTYAPSTPITVDYTLEQVSKNMGDEQTKVKVSGRITREEFMHNGTQLRYATYTYDALNRITQINDGDISSTYVYDTFGRLLQDRNTGKRYTYTYDDNGNILTKKYLVTTTNYTYDSTYKDKLIGYGSKTIKYTGIDDKYPTEYGEYQNNVLYNGEKYTWDRNRLVSITKVVNGVDQTPITYTYNVNGLRQSKTVNGNTTYFIYNNDLLVTQYDNSESYQFLYDENNMLFGFIRTDLTTNIKTPYFYIRRINGRIDGIMNASDGSIAVYYVCGAYGEIHQTYDYTTFGLGNKNPFRWMGYYYDVETGLFWLSSRYYSPELCRFISPDDVGYLDPESINGLNLYAYAKNNPIMYYDPSGHSAILVIGLLVGSFIVGAGASVVSQGLTYGWDEINYWQAGVDGLFALGSTALAMTGIGALASAGIGAVAGWSQYAIGSAFHGEDLTLLGSLTATGLGFIGGAISGAGARNGVKIASSMKLTGKGASAVKAITTASNRYLAGEISMKGLQATTRLWGNVAFNAVQDAISPTIRSLMINGAITIAGVTIGTAAVNYGLTYVY